MSERKYTVDEVERMRRAVESLWRFGVAARLENYMLNGIDPDELEATASEYRARQRGPWS